MQNRAVEFAEYCCNFPQSWITSSQSAAEEPCALTKNLEQLRIRPSTFRLLLQINQQHVKTLVKPMTIKLTDRRDFLKASAAATLFPAPFVRAQSKDKKYRTALIGSGTW